MTSPRNERLHNLWVTAVGGIIATVVGGTILAIWSDQRATDNSPTPASSASMVIPGPLLPPDNDAGAASQEPASLAQLSTSEVLQRDGTVVGRPLPPSPTFALRGSQCGDPTATYVGDLAGRFETLELVASVDDVSPAGARVDLRVHGDGELLAHELVEAGTSGTTVAADVADVDEVSIIMTALTRTERCDLDQLQIHLAEGVAR